MIRSIRMSVSKKYRYRTLAEFCDPDQFWSTLYDQFRTKRVQEICVTPEDEIQAPAGDDLFVVYSGKREYRARSLERLRRIPGVTVAPGGNIRLALKTLLLTIQSSNSKKLITLYRVFPTGTTLNEIDPRKKYQYPPKKVRITPAQVFAVAFIERSGKLEMMASKYQRDTTYSALVKKGVVAATSNGSSFTLTIAMPEVFREALDNYQLSDSQIAFLRRTSMNWIGAEDWRLAQLNYICPVQVDGRIHHYELTDHGRRKLLLEEQRHVG